MTHCMYVRAARRKPADLGMQGASRNRRLTPSGSDEGTCDCLELHVCRIRVYG